MIFIDRKECFNFLLRHKDKQVIKFISGIKGCGRTTLLDTYKDQLIKTGISKEQLISINLEDISYQDKNYKELYFYIKNKLIEGKMTYIFLDEIQNCKNFEKMVDSLFIQPNVDIYIIGSNAYFMSGELATLLSGRYVELKILPLSFKEYVSGVNDSKSNVAKYKDYITFSSFPYTIWYKDDLKAAQDYLRGIYSTILLKDVVQRYKITDVMMLESVASFIFDNIGNRLSVNNISNILTANGRTTNDKTIEKYLQALINSLIIYQVKRYNIKGRQLLKTQAKYYIADLGLRYLICGIKGKDEGHILENVIYLELLRRGYNVYIGQNEENEIDFVASTHEDTIFIHVSLSLRDSNTYEREIAPLKAIKNSKSKIILTMEEAPVKYNNGNKIN